MDDQAEVGSLSRRVILQPVSARLQSGIRFFRYPIPAEPTVFLAGDLPLPAARRAYRVPHASQRVGWVLPLHRRYSSPRAPFEQEGQPNHVPFWFKPVSIFGLSFFAVPASSSHVLTRSLKPCTFSALMLAESAPLLAERSAAFRPDTLSPWLHTTPLPATHARVGYG